MTALPSPASSAAIIAIGASSPIGYGVAPIQAAMAGGLRNFQETDLVAGEREGETPRTSRMPDLDETAPRAERLALLVAAATRDFLNDLAVPLPPALPVHVGLAGDAPSADLRAVAQGLAHGSGRRLMPDPKTTSAYSVGRIAFLAAMAQATRSFGASTDVALVVAADTRCTWMALDSMMRQRRILTTGDDGTVPGEAAIVVLVASPTSKWAKHARFLVAEPAFAEDDFEAMRRSPQVAGGLGRVFRALREHPVAGSARPASVIGFESGELFFTRAFTTGYLRNAELMPEPLRHELVAANVGDTGAAAAGMALVRAGWLMSRPDSPPRSRVLIYGHSDDGRCAAAMVIGQERGSR